MTIDPRLYEKYSGRSGDPTRALGEVLARNAKAKQIRDELPRGFLGGFRMLRWPGIFAQLFVWSKSREAEREANSTPRRPKR